MCRIRGMRRDDICLSLGPADRSELQALITSRNTVRKLVWRADIVLATAGGHGTFEIMRPHVKADSLAVAAAISR